MHNQKGFSPILIIITIATIALLGFIAWRVWDANQNGSDNQQLQTSTDQVQGVVSSDDGDLYAGWSLFCDENEQLCFKYPADWDIESSMEGDITSVVLRSPDNRMAGTYTNYDTRDGSDGLYYVAALRGLEFMSTASDKYSVLGGYVVGSTGGVLPKYKIIDKDLADSLVVGRNATMNVTERFTLDDGMTGRFEVYPIGVDSFDEESAKLWFDTDDGRLAESITHSFYEAE
ncbi:MAG: hypothetical protein PVI21_01270 [Candidatus Woesebacteria bacterium]|jgi:hypothetical protein